MQPRREFLKQLGIGTVSLGLLQTLPNISVFASSSQAAFPRSSPESQGISSEDILRFLHAVNESGQEFHSLMILRHGQVVTEGWWAPYSAEHKQQIYSMSKSFTSTAIGFAVDAHLLSVEDPVISFFPEMSPDTVSENLSFLKVKHLLMMSVGHEKDSIRILEASPEGTPWQKTFLSIPVVEQPGTRFMYNSGASFMLAAIVQKVTGQSAHDYLKPRLFKPLGIENSTWTTNPDGINMGASHLRMRTEDLAKFGQFYLQKGMWNGKQLLSKEWIAAATSKQINNGKDDSSWGYGYGYQFWLNPPGGYRADGAFGQYSMVFPDNDAVVVITSESLSTKDTMQLVWDKLVPAMKDAPLPANKTAKALLEKELKGLAYHPPKVNTTSPLASQISGKTFKLEKNEFNAEAITFNFKGDKCMVTLKEKDKPDIRITHGNSQWIREGNYKPSPHSLFSLRRIDFDSIVAASATWEDEKTLLLTWRLIETVHGDSLRCTFNGNNVHLKLLFSVPALQHKEDDRPELIGTMA